MRCKPSSLVPPNERTQLERQSDTANMMESYTEISTGLNPYDEAWRMTKTYNEPTVLLMLSEASSESLVTAAK
jgi:hypothetical protein